MYEYLCVCVGMQDERNNVAIKKKWWSLLTQEMQIRTHAHIEQLRTYRIKQHTHMIFIDTLKLGFEHFF